MNENKQATVPTTSRNWSDPEREVVREHYPTAGAAACVARLPGRSATAIRQLARSLGIEAPSQAWGDDEVAVLRRCYPAGGARACVPHLPASRTYGAIEKKAKSLRLRAPLREWTVKEEAVLRATFPKSGTRGCVPLLPRRTARAIRLRANDLGLCSPVVWDEAELVVLREQFPVLGPKACSRLLPGRSVAAVRKKAGALGLSAPDDSWGEAEDAVLREHYTDGGTRRCVQLLPHRTRGAVGERARQLGLRAGAQAIKNRKGKAIRTLQALEARCAKDADCWLWPKGDGPARVWGAAEVLGENASRTVTPQHLALCLSQRRPRRGAWVWIECRTDGCCNPAHLIALTSKQYVARAVKAGVFKTAARRAAQLKAAEARRTTTPEQERAILAAQIVPLRKRRTAPEGSVTKPELAQQLGLTETVIDRVLRTARAPLLLPQASVFAQAA